MTTMPHLVRNTNNMWSYFPPTPCTALGRKSLEVTEVQLEAPSSLGADQKFLLIDKVAKLIHQRAFVTFASLQKPIDIHFTREEPSVPGHWKAIAVRAHKTCMQRIFQYFPCTRMMQNQKLVKMKIVNIRERCFQTCLNRFFKKVQSAFYQPSQTPIGGSSLARPYPESDTIKESDTIEFYIKQKPFQDPFTELAATSAQKTEKYYEMERSTESSFRYVMKGKTLYLVEMEAQTAAVYQEPSLESHHSSPSSSFLQIPLNPQDITTISEPSPDTTPRVLSPSAQDFPLSDPGTPVKMFLPEPSISPAPPPSRTTSRTTTSSPPQDAVHFNIIDESTLKLENRNVIMLFKNHLVQEYGFWIIDFLKKTYFIDLVDMHENGRPLTPTHVLKANIAANNIEMGHIFALLTNLKKMFVRLDHSEILETPFLEFLHLDKCGIKNYLSMRELRNLIYQVQQPRQDLQAITCKNVLEYLANTFHINSTDRSISSNPSSLPKSAFNILVSLVMTKKKDLDFVFTGRKINHLPIFGYNTMGSSSIPNRCRDLFELLHIFPQLKDSTWPAYYELLSHVVAKKTLYRPNLDDDGEHVGFLIPGPTGTDGQETWYYNDTFIDDGNGNFSYTLRPACDNYTFQESPSDTRSKPLPFIKLYRSTASSKSNPNSGDSIAADFNYKGPGSLKPELSFHYEKDTFVQRTIPMWMGYVLLGRHFKDNKPASYGRWMHLAVDLFTHYRRFHQLEGKIPQAEIKFLQKMLEGTKYPEILTYLIEKATELHERPQEKIGQDIAFVGHSLGGALAQAGVYEFCTQTKRIPLPGYTIICSTSHPPGTENKKNTRFMTTGDIHEEMLLLNNIHFQITHQLEKGDIVPQSGESHLGSKIYLKPNCCCIRPTTYAPERPHPWLDFSAYVFAPLPGATSQEIVGAPTHGRRIGHSKLDIDYTITPLTQKDMHDYDHAWILFRGKLAPLFGYKFISCPKITEFVRRNSGLSVRLYRKIKNFFSQMCSPVNETLDDNEVLYLRFSSNRALRQLTTRQ